MYGQYVLLLLIYYNLNANTTRSISPRLVPKHRQKYNTLTQLSCYKLTTVSANRKNNRQSILRLLLLYIHIDADRQGNCEDQDTEIADWYIVTAVEVDLAGQAELQRNEGIYAYI